MVRLPLKVWKADKCASVIGWRSEHKVFDVILPVSREKWPAGRHMFATGICLPEYHQRLGLDTLGVGRGFPGIGAVTGAIEGSTYRHVYYMCTAEDIRAIWLLRSQQ